ncbi:MAG: gliding motility-associated protein GldE [Bacteroidales bacterium]
MKEAFFQVQYHDFLLSQSPAWQLSHFSIVLIFLFISFLLVALAFINASEVAFFALKPSQLKEIRVNESNQDDLVAKLLQDPRKLLATILIAVNFLNVSIVIIFTFISNALINFSDYPVIGFVLQVLVLTLIILFFGEILPKVFASQRTIQVAIFMARPMSVLIRILTPLSSILTGSTQFVDKKLARKYTNISMSELEEAIDITTDANTPEDEKKILKGIVNFGEIEVREIMKSRIFITAVEKSLNFYELLHTIKDSGYSRIPVYEENLDTVTGVLHIKDFLPHLNKEESFDWHDLIRPAFFVPENKKINDLLEEFQSKKIHLAIVVDEYGGTSGIITLEDVIEEIVGEINDEFDTDPESAGFSKVDDYNYFFSGEIPITDFCRIMKIEPEVFEKVKGESGTLAGLILEMTGKMPEQDAKISFGRLLFRIEKADQRRIHKIKVTISESADE